MKNFDFDTFPDRKNTCSSKWSELKSEKEIPMSIADMDFRSPDCVVEALKERSQHGMFGYTYVGDDFYQAFCDWEKKIHGSDVKNEEIILQKQFDQRYILSDIETYAVNNLGMVKLESNMMEYIELSSPDTITVIDPGENYAISDFFTGIWNQIKEFLEFLA